MSILALGIRWHSKVYTTSLFYSTRLLSCCSSSADKFYYYFRKSLQFLDKLKKMPVTHGSKVGACTGKKFLVTGGSRGIGRAVVEELYAQGATVYALARNPDKLKALKEELPLVNTICADVADWSATRKALENLEPMDGLINNAGIDIEESFMNLTEASFDKIFATNLKSVVNISQVVASKMIQKGVGGAIVNISSSDARKPFLDSMGYCCLKAALEMLSKGMALEFASHKITVNTVCPAGVDTDMLRNSLGSHAEEEFEKAKQRIPTGVPCMPMSDIVNAIIFFASRITSNITGESLVVDGGSLLK